MNPFTNNSHILLFQKSASEKHDLVFYANRSTPKVVERGQEPKSKKGYGAQTKRRAATEDEEKQIAKGKWVRVDEAGNKPNNKNYKKTKYRPKLLKKKSSISFTCMNPFTQPDNRTHMLKQAVIRKEDGKYKLYTRDGKRVLGVHNTRQEAIKQEYAIEKSQEKRAGLGSDTWRAIQDTAKEQWWNPAGWVARGYDQAGRGAGRYTEGMLEGDWDKALSGNKDMITGAVKSISTAAVPYSVGRLAAIKPGIISVPVSAGASMTGAQSYVDSTQHRLPSSAKRLGETSFGEEYKKFNNRYLDQYSPQLKKTFSSGDHRANTEAKNYRDQLIQSGHSVTPGVFTTLLGNPDHNKKVTYYSVPDKDPTMSAAPDLKYAGLYSREGNYILLNNRYNFGDPQQPYNGGNFRHELTHDSQYNQTNDDSLVWKNKRQNPFLEFYPSPSERQEYLLRPVEVGARLQALQDASKVLYNRRIETPEQFMRWIQDGKHPHKKDPDSTRGARYLERYHNMQDYKLMGPEVLEHLSKLAPGFAQSQRATPFIKTSTISGNDPDDTTTPLQRFDHGPDQPALPATRFQSIKTQPLNQQDRQALFQPAIKTPRPNEMQPIQTKQPAGYDWDAQAEFTANWEGFEPKRYFDDSEGKRPTIGYGSNLDEPHIRKLMIDRGLDPDRLNTGEVAIEEPIARELMMGGLRQAHADARTWMGDETFNSLPPEAQQVFTDMSYNLGLTKLMDFEDTHEAIQDRDWGRTADEMKDSSWYEQTKRRGEGLVDIIRGLSQPSAE